MLKTISRNKQCANRIRRVRAKVTGSAECPRLTVYKSLRSISVQVIDDAASRTLLSARLAEVKGAKNTVEGAKSLGGLVAKKCADAGITTIVFDRRGHRFHGKIKSVADGAREAGLKF